MPVNHENIDDRAADVISQEQADAVIRNAFRQYPLFETLSSSNDPPSNEIPYAPPLPPLSKPVKQIGKVARFDSGLITGLQPAKFMGFGRGNVGHHRC